MPTPSTLASDLGLGHAVLDARHVAQQDRMALRLPDDDVAELLDASRRGRGSGA